MTDAPKYKPDAVKSPGDILTETLEDLGITHADFRQKADIERDYYYRFVGGKAALSDELATRLERWAKLPKWVWERQEKKWQQHCKLQEEEE